MRANSYLVNQEIYEDWKKSSHDFEYTFSSVGPKGEVSILVHLNKLRDPDIFDLAFGVDLKNGDFNDLARVSNRDRDKILATVVAIIVEFTFEYPEKIICFTGSTPARTRLYRMIISLNLEELSQDFIIFGELDQSPDCWEEFQKGRPYVSFAIKRKINNLHI